MEKKWFFEFYYNIILPKFSNTRDFLGNIFGFSNKWAPEKFSFYNFSILKVSIWNSGKNTKFFPTENEIFPKLYPSDKYSLNTSGNLNDFSQFIFCPKSHSVAEKWHPIGDKGLRCTCITWYSVFKKWQSKIIFRAICFMWFTKPFKIYTKKCWQVTEILIVGSQFGNDGKCRL